MAEILIKHIANRSAIYLQTPFLRKMQDQRDSTYLLSSELEF